MWTTAAGRRTQPASDASDPRGLRVDVDARIGWLLRKNRIGSPYGGTCSSLAERLRNAGYPTNTSWLSRRETGSLPVPMGLLQAMESQLRIPPGHLAGAARYQRIMLRSISRPQTVDTEYDMAQDQLLLDDVADCVAGGRATAVTWLAMAELLSTGRAVIPRGLLTRWAGLLAWERDHCIGGEYAARSAALGELLGTPSIALTVARAVLGTVNQRGVVHVEDGYAILGCVASPTIQGELVSILAGSDGARRFGAARALVQALSTSSIGPDVAAALASTVLELSVDHRNADLALMLATRMSATMHHTVLARCGHRSRPETDQNIRSRVRPLLRAAYDATGVEDPMLERLLSEAMDPRRDERRRHAAVLIAATPYAEHLANALANLDRHGTRGANDPNAVLASYLLDASSPREPETVVTGGDFAISS